MTMFPGITNAWTNLWGGGGQAPAPQQQPQQAPPVDYSQQYPGLAQFGFPDEVMQSLLGVSGPGGEPYGQMLAGALSHMGMQKQNNRQTQQQALARGQGFQDYVRSSPYATQATQMSESPDRFLGGYREQLENEYDRVNEQAASGLAARGMWDSPQRFSLGEQIRQNQGIQYQTERGRVQQAGQTHLGNLMGLENQVNNALMAMEMQGVENYDDLYSGLINPLIGLGQSQIDQDLAERQLGIMSDQAGFQNMMSLLSMFTGPLLQTNAPYNWLGGLF